MYSTRPSSQGQSLVEPASVAPEAMPVLHRAVGAARPRRGRAEQSPPLAPEVARALRMMPLVTVITVVWCAVALAAMIMGVAG